MLYKNNSAEWTSVIAAVLKSSRLISTKNNIIEMMVSTKMKIPKKSPLLARVQSTE